MKHLKISALALTAFMALTSCSNDDDAKPVNEEEVITTVTATFTPQDGGTPIILSSRDLDGDGPDAPIVTVSGDFEAGASYNGTVTFLNELENPAENISEEIEEEGDEHQIFFRHTGLGEFIYADTDINGHPVGLNFVYNAPANATEGLLTITLKHQPDKFADGVANGNMANAGGSTDAEVYFTISVVLP